MSKTTSTTTSTTRDLSVITEELELLCNKFNEEVAGKKREEEIDKMNTDFDILIAEFNKASKSKCYQKIEKCKNKMYGAIKEFSYASCRILDKVNEKNQLVREVRIGSREISLPDVNKHFNGIGANKEWENFVEKFNYLMTKRACTKLNAKSNLTQYAFKKTSETFNISVDDLEKEENVKVALQAVITAMLGDGKVVSDEDVYYVKSVHLKKGKAACTVTATQLRAMHSLILNICHRILTKCDYEVSFKTKDKK